MLYAKSIKTDANTAKADAKITRFKVTNGVIYEVSIYFPPGCAGLVYIQIFEGGHQFIPSTEGQFLKGENFLLNIKEFYEIKNAPRYITVKTWNLDEVYNHTIEVMIKQLPKNILLPAFLIKDAVERLIGVFR